MRSEGLRVPVHTDERGDLLAVELDEVPFDVRRLFVVTAVPAGMTRGGHRADCRELLVLVRGCAEILLNGRTVVLQTPGDALLVDPDDQLSYRLADESSALLVLADRPWRPRSEP